MKIRSVRANNRRRIFEVVVGEQTYPFPYSWANPVPSSPDSVAGAYVDEELGAEGFTYQLKSGAEGSVHMDSVLEYNEDPVYLRDLLLYNLTVEARRCMDESPLSQREIIRRAGTSASQVNRLLDVSNRAKSVDKLIVLLAAMDCEVDFVVRPSRKRRSNGVSGASRV